MRRREFIAGLGGAAAWPLAARAQQPVIQAIGYLTVGIEEPSLSTQFHRGLGEQGYVDGRNAEILYRRAQTRGDRSAMAADLVRSRVTVLVGTTAGCAVAAKSATATIPIVFVTGADPVELGLVASLGRPSGNVTGATFLTWELTAKRLQLLHEIVPGASSIAFLVNPEIPGVENEIKAVENAARILGVRLTMLNATTPTEIEAAFATVNSQLIGAVFLGNTLAFLTRRTQLVALAARYSVPVVYPFRENVDAGGLMSYGAAISDAWYLAGTYAGRILKGEKPADLPVLQSTKFEFAINLKTAKALGLAIPAGILAIAAEVIE
jgi:putative tryptophan/tyrosine transport system substrate-binding protein